MPAPKSILLIHAGALGDFVLSLSLAGRVAEEFAGGRLAALCRSRIACFFVKQGVLASWKSLENPKFLSLFADDDEPAEDVRDYLSSFDVVVSMIGGPEAALSSRLRGLFSGSLYCVDPKLRGETQDQGGHIVEQWVADLRRQGLTLAGGNGRPYLAQAKACGSLISQEAGRNAGSGAVVIHPGSGGIAKCWPVEHFEKLARRIREDGRSVEFMVGPVEMDVHGEQLRSRLSRTAPVFYEEDVCIAAEHVAGAAAFVGNDAGMTHLAAYLGIPTIAVFVSTSSMIWRPLGQNVTIVDLNGSAEAAIESTVQGILEQLS